LSKKGQFELQGKTLNFKMRKTDRIPLLLGSIKCFSISFQDFHVFKRGGYAMYAMLCMLRPLSHPQIFLLQNAASSLPVKPTWLQRSSTLQSIGPPASPEPSPWKLTELLFSIHSWRLPPKQWPLWPVQDATDREPNV
jgi:hypothetical protein